MTGAFDLTAVWVLRRNERPKQPKSPGGPVLYLNRSECAERAYVEEPQSDAQVPPGWIIALILCHTTCCRDAHRSRKARTLEVGGGYQHVPPDTAPRLESREDRAREQADGKFQRIGSYDQMSQRPDILTSTDSLGV